MQYPVYNWDRLARNYMPCLGQTRTKSHTLFRAERPKNIPCPAAHPCIGNIREYPPLGLQSVERVGCLQSFDIHGHLHPMLNSFGWHAQKCWTQACAENTIYIIKRG